MIRVELEELVLLPAIQLKNGAKLYAAPNPIDHISSLANEEERRGILLPSHEELLPCAHRI